MQERPSARLAGPHNLTTTTRGGSTASLNCTVDASWGAGKVGVMATPNPNNNSNPNTNPTLTLTPTPTLTLTLTR